MCYFIIKGCDVVMDKELLRRYLNDDSFKAVSWSLEIRKSYWRMIFTSIMKMRLSSIRLRIAHELSHLALFLI